VPFEKNLYGTFANKVKANVHFGGNETTLKIRLAPGFGGNTTGEAGKFWR